MKEVWPTTMEYQARKLGASVPMEKYSFHRQNDAINSRHLVLEPWAMNSANFEQPFSDWLCLFTQPHRERLAAGNLSEIGFKVYLPFQRKLVLRKRKRVPVKTPLFPRYIFICAAKENVHLFGAHRQPGVTGLAGRSFSQSLIKNSIIQAIKARECPDGYVELQSTSIKSGQKVSITNGPFAALEAIFCEAKDEQRSILLLSLLGKTHRVVVPTQNIELMV